MFFWITVAAGLIMLGVAALFVGSRKRDDRPIVMTVDSTDYIHERRRADHGNNRRGPRLHAGGDREA